MGIIGNPRPQAGDIWRQTTTRRTFRVESIDPKRRINAREGFADVVWLGTRTKGAMWLGVFNNDVEFRRISCGDATGSLPKAAGEEAEG